MYHELPSLISLHEKAIFLSNIFKKFKIPLSITHRKKDFLAFSRICFQTKMDGRQQQQQQQRNWQWVSALKSGVSLRRRGQRTKKERDFLRKEAIGAAESLGTFFHVSLQATFSFFSPVLWPSMPAVLLTTEKQAKLLMYWKPVVVVVIMSLIPLSPFCSKWKKDIYNISEIFRAREKILEVIHHDIVS